MIQKLLSVTALAGLVACGGGGGGGVTATAGGGGAIMPPSSPSLTTAASFQTLLDNGAALDDAGPRNLTTSETLAAQGTASYDGFIEFFGNSTVTGNNEPTAQDIAGELNMTVTFSGDDQLTGTVSNLTRRDGTTFDGDLTLSNPNVSSFSDGGIFAADIVGRVEDTNGVRADFDTRLRAADAFGSDAEQIRGSVGGEIDYLNLKGTDIIFGSFVADKQ